MVSDLEAVFFKIVTNFKLDAYLKFRSVDKRQQCIPFFSFFFLFFEISQFKFSAENDEANDSHTSKVLNFVTEYALIRKKRLVVHHDVL